MKVVIMQGIPGAGKSTYVDALRYEGSQRLPEWQDSIRVVSADHFFYERGNGRYAFDPALLPIAHGQCLRQFTSLITERHERVRAGESPALFGVIVVDNTNTSPAEVAPYAALALAFNFEVEVVYVRVVDPFLAHARCVHGVPLTTVCAMHDRLNDPAVFWPPWWNRRVIAAGS